MELDGGQLFWIIAISLGGGVLVIWSIIEHLDNRLKANTKRTIARAKEETRREIAAYVAEGSISPDDAVRLMAAGEGLDGVKSGLREVLSKGAKACAEAGKQGGVRVEIHKDQPEPRGAPRYETA